MGARGFVALAIVAVLGAGCTGDPEPKIADPTPSASVASPSPTADPEQEYRDFIDSYVAAVSDSLSTGDPSAWLEMSDPACENCANLASGLEDAYEDGGSIEGGRWTLTGAKKRGSSEIGDLWLVDVESARERWVARDGSLVKTVPAGTNHFTFAIGTSAGDLKLRELEFVE